MSRLKHSEKIILQACRLCISQSHSRAGWGTHGSVSLSRRLRVQSRLFIGQWLSLIALRALSLGLPVLRRQSLGGPRMQARRAREWS